MVAMGAPTPHEPRRRGRARGALAVAAVAAAGAIAGIASLRLAGPVEGDVGPGRVALAAHADATPRTELRVPPLGSVTAQTHRAPLTMWVRVEQLDLVAVEEVVGAPSVERRLRADIEADLLPLVRELFARSFAVAALGGALLGAVVPGRRWRTIAVGAVGGLVGAGAVLWSAWAGFDPDAFEEPRFDGPISEAPRVLATVREYVEGADAVSSRLEVLSAQIGDLYASSVTDAIAEGPGSTRILHVSDVHLNPLGVEVIRQLASRFDVDAVLDTGDVTSFGHDLEGEFGRLLDEVGVPYFVVPGNHDSPANRAALGGYDGVTILDGEVVDIAGVRVLGVAHPVFTADNRTPADEVADAVEAQAERVGRLVRLTDPDVLAVHDPAQAVASHGDVGLVVAGHVHETTWRDEDGSIVLTVGSTGATGLGAFTVDADLAYEASVLYFDGGELVAVDAIALRGTDGDFRIDRRLVRPPGDDDQGG
jgi:predicted phosphodiesterase